MITPAYLRSILHYEPLSKTWTWLRASRRRPAGSVAGTQNRGYRAIRIDGKTYPAHRLAEIYRLDR